MLLSAIEGLCLLLYRALHKYLAHVRYSAWILISNSRKLLVLAIVDIIWIEAYGDYSHPGSTKVDLNSNYRTSTVEEEPGPTVSARSPVERR